MAAMKEVIVAAMEARDLVRVRLMHPIDVILLFRAPVCETAFFAGC